MPTAEEVKARPDTWIPTAAEVGARPSDWLPTAEEVGAVTSQDMDTAKTTAIAEAKTYTDAQVKRAAPRNLLDNSDFRNPVNQRGFVSGTVGSTKYTIDRWRLQYTTYLGLEPDCISMWGSWSMWQHVSAKIEKGKNYTLAVEVKGETGNEKAFLEMSADASGRLISHTENNIGTSWKIITVTVTADRDIAAGEYNFNVGIDNSNGQSTKTFYRWAALYEGEYTAETLPEYRPKGYGAELFECMRYYQQSFTDNPQSMTNVQIVFGANTNWLSTVKFPVPMRVTPEVILYDNVTGNADGVSIWKIDEPVSDVFAGCVGTDGFNPVKSGYMTENLAYGLHYTADAELR